MTEETKKSQNLIDDTYKLGFHDDLKYSFISKKGLTEETVREISKMKNESDWMTDFRIKAYKIFLEKSMPTWMADEKDLKDIKFDEIYYYLESSKKQEKSWNDVPDEIKKTFDKIGVPQAEREFLGGVKSQYDSTVVYGSLLKELEDQGVIFLGTDDALQKYPEIFKEYFGTVVPPRDNKFAALNSAVWSGGSFVYIPKGVHVDRPLQAYFRINAENAGQFERTLIIAEEDSFVHYVEGCFTKDTLIKSNPSLKLISDIKVGDKVLTHVGEYKKVYQTQKRKYSGNLYTVKVWGDSTSEIKVTEEHPFLCVRRDKANERNFIWKASWIPSKTLNARDYLLIPVDGVIKSEPFHNFGIEIGDVTKRGKPLKKEIISVPSSPAFFRLVGYYLAEGSVDKRGYLRFSFSAKERFFIDDVKSLIKELFGHEKFHEFTYKDRAGVELVFSSVKLARIFEQFGTSVYKKQIPHWMMQESYEKQKELISGYFRGDGNYYKRKHNSGFKETFRINTVSEILAKQVRDILFRLGVFAFLNKRDRAKENRKTMYTIGITGEYLSKFGEIVGIPVSPYVNGHKRATMFYLDSKFAYVPIKSLSKKKVKKIDVYNFGVDDDESYVANVAVHNCSAPSYSSGSLHSAVVEIIVKKGARVRYTTIQNWYKNVYNLVTKRAVAYEDAVMEWVDGNIGSRLTVKFPSVYLMGERARGEILSIAYAGNGQHQHAGGKVIHAAPNTSSRITSKSISAQGGRTSYRGLVEVNLGAVNAKSRVECDALILDPESRSDTYPVMKVNEAKVNIEHEATVSRVGEEQLFYLMSRGLSKAEAMNLVVSGFMEPIVKELPLEYAVELNKLIELEMEGSVG